MPPPERAAAHPADQSLHAPGLAGVVEDLDLTYDPSTASTTRLMSPRCPSRPSAGVTCNSNQIRRSTFTSALARVMSKPSQDYVRNHISTAVDVRSLASVDRYVSQTHPVRRVVAPPNQPSPVSGHRHDHDDVRADADVGALVGFTAVVMSDQRYWFIDRDRGQIFMPPAAVSRS